MQKNLFRNKEDKAGLYLTVIFHLTVIIVLLLYSIDTTIRREESFVLDFSKQEEIERREKEEIFKEDKKNVKIMKICALNLHSKKKRKDSRLRNLHNKKRSGDKLKNVINKC